MQNNLAEKIARVVVYRAEAWCKRKKTHLCVVNDVDRTPPTFPYHWQFRNTFGCTWPHSERAAAIAWAKEALAAGYSVFWGVPKTGGGGSGCSIKIGVRPSDVKEAEQWFEGNGRRLAPNRSAA